jgi:PAS domain S-box-containing protein
MPSAAHRILVVDDDAVTRHILVGYLTRAGYETATAQSGDEALDLASRSLPSLVLLDLVIPAPDGYEILRRLRASARTRDLPVVVLTALEGDEEIERAFEAGADDFLRKPFRAGELLARIRGQLRLRGYLVALAQKERDAQVMVELTQTLASSLDFRDILFKVVRRIAEVVNVDRVSIVVAREQGNLGYVVAASDDAGVQNLPLDLDKYPEIQKVLQTRAPLTIDDVATHPVLGAVRDSVTSSRFTSLTLLPISYEGRALGVLFLRAAETRGRLGDRELSFCQIVANATAVALRNARVLQQLRDETQAITTARFEAERRVHILERYADLFTSAADGMVVIDHNGRTLFSNPKASEILGYNEEEVRKQPAPAFVVREDRPRIAALRRGFARGEFPTNVDLRVPRKDGVVRTLSISFSSLLREERAILVTFRDVTDDRATASELARTKDFLTALIESSPDAIVAADRAGEMLLWNRAAERICGIRRDEIVNRRNVASIYKPGVAQEIMRKIRGAGYGGAGRLEGYRTEVLDAAGEPIPILLSAGIVHEGTRESGTIGIFSDLRERLRIEERLAQAQQKLASSERQMLLAELAGAAAHELNQPLTAIMGYAGLLCRVSRDSPAARSAEVMMREAERMAEIVRKIGQITHYETKGYVGGTNIIDIDASTTSGTSGLASVAPPPPPGSRLGTSSAPPPDKPAGGAK